MDKDFVVCCILLGFILALFMIGLCSNSNPYRDISSEDKEVKIKKIKYSISDTNILDGLIKQHGEAKVCRLKFNKKFWDCNEFGSYLTDEKRYSLDSYFTDYSLNGMGDRIKTKLQIKAFKVEPGSRSLICVTEKDKRRIKCKHLEVRFEDGFKKVIF